MRTKRDPALNLSQPIQVMVTPAEREQAEALARSQGRSVSGFMRVILLQRLARSGRKPSSC